MNALIIRVDRAGQSEHDQYRWISEKPGKGDVGYEADPRKACVFTAQEALALYDSHFDGLPVHVRMYELKGDPPEPDWLNPRCYGVVASR
jgi:hypothetical protein